MLLVPLELDVHFRVVIFLKVGSCIVQSAGRCKLPSEAVLLYSGRLPLDAFLYSAFRQMNSYLLDHLCGCRAACPVHCRTIDVKSHLLPTTRCLRPSLLPGRKLSWAAVYQCLSLSHVAVPTATLSPHCHAVRRAFDQ